MCAWIERLLVGSGLCLTVSACCELGITTTELPNGKVGEAYNQKFEAECDNNEWELISGDLPPGLTLNQGGELIGVPTLAGTYTLTVGVSGEGEAAGDFVSKGFALLIIQPVGTLQVTTATTGSSVDPNGYTLSVGTDQNLIGVNETRSLPGVPVGDVTVTLGDLDSGCSVTGQNPVTATITEGSVTDVTFDVACP